MEHPTLADVEAVGPLEEHSIEMTSMSMWIDPGTRVVYEADFPRDGMDVEMFRWTVTVHRGILLGAHSDLGVVKLTQYRAPYTEVTTQPVKSDMEALVRIGPATDAPAGEPTALAASRDTPSETANARGCLTSSAQ